MSDSGRVGATAALSQCQWQVRCSSNYGRAPGQGSTWAWHGTLWQMRSAYLPRRPLAVDGAPALPVWHWQGH
jgi:hypothetical protein